MHTIKVNRKENRSGYPFDAVSKFHKDRLIVSEIEETKDDIDDAGIKAGAEDCIDPL